MIIVGTSGFSYRDWRGNFYPESLKQDEYLSYYAGHFGAVEINTSYYGIPRPETFRKMIERTPDGFEFMVKANRATTHENRDTEVRNEFYDSLAPLAGAGRLAGILAQFPWGFRNDERNRHYLAGLAANYTEFPLYVEFRHNSWDCEEIYTFLKKIGLRFVSADEPQIGGMMPPLARATADTAYVRFHGRNAENWWGETGDRYDYLYPENELDEWVEKVHSLEKTVWKLYAFFNNCHHGYAVRNARMFQELVKKKSAPQ
jgi:uncharacterized protein YecE (DUF72 family)